MAVIFPDNVEALKTALVASGAGVTETSIEPDKVERSRRSRSLKGLLMESERVLMIVSRETEAFGGSCEVEAS